MPIALRLFRVNYLIPLTDYKYCSNANAVIANKTDIEMDIAILHVFRYEQYFAVIGTHYTIQIALSVDDMKIDIICY